MSNQVPTILGRCELVPLKHATYSQPFAKGMAKTSRSMRERPRFRILTDDKIGAL